MLYLFYILVWLLPECVILRLLRVGWFRRLLVRRGLKRALRYCWNRRDSGWFVFVGSHYSGMSSGLCILFGNVWLLSYSPEVESVLFPEFGTRVEEFGGTRSRGYWWGTSVSALRVDYLRWLCSCYGIDMDKYFNKLAR